MDPADGLSRYVAPGAKRGTWNVESLPGIQITRRAQGWQTIVSSRHPGLSSRAGEKGEQIYQASKLLLHTGMLHKYFSTRQEVLRELLQAAAE